MSGGEQKINTLYGEITSPEYDREDVAICHIINATVVRNFGLPARLAKIYPYADVYGSRKQLYNLDRATVSHRNRLGEVLIYKEPSRPFIVCFVAHFGPRGPLEVNETAQYYIKNSQDRHFVEGLKKDTEKDRLQALQQCVEKLSSWITAGAIPIRSIYIPAGTGTTLQGRSWDTKYLPILELLADQAKTSNIQLTILDIRLAQEQRSSSLRRWVPSVDEKREVLQQSLPLLSIEDLGNDIVCLLDDKDVTVVGDQPKQPP